MKKINAVSTFCMVLLFLVGCTRNNVIVVVPKPQTPPGSSITEHQFLLAQPCILPQDLEEGKYATAKIVSQAYAASTDRAKADHMSGCAAVQFHLNSDGTTRDVKLVRENPKDYGFGTQIVHVAEASVYQAPADVDKWYLQISVITPNSNYATVFSGGPEHYKKYAEFFQTH